MRLKDKHQLILLAIGIGVFLWVLYNTDAQGLARQGQGEGKVGDGNYVVQLCPSPITAIVYTKYFTITIAVIGEGQCPTTQLPIADPTDLTSP